MIESQTDFALRIGVSRQCVAGYIKRRKLTGAALVHEGGSVLIDVDEGRRQLDRRLDGDQRVANGKAKLGRSKPPVQTTAVIEQSEPTDSQALAAMSVFLHTKGLPEAAASNVMAFGGTPRQAYMSYLATLGEVRFNYTLSFGETFPDEYDPFPLDFIRDEYGIEVGSDDLERWNAEWERQYNEPEAA